MFRFIEAKGNIHLIDLNTIPERFCRFIMNFGILLGNLQI